MNDKASSPNSLGTGLYGKGYSNTSADTEKGKYIPIIPEQLYSAEGLLEDGLHVLSERGKQYDPQGKTERSMEKIVAAFKIITGKELTEAEGWMFMAVLKQVRSFQRPGFHADSAQDFVCYSALYGEAKAKEWQRGERVKKEEPVKKVEPFKKITSGIQGAARRFEDGTVVGPNYLAMTSEAVRRDVLRTEAYHLYSDAAKSMGLPHAASWEEMHPSEQQGWMCRAQRHEDTGLLPIINPATRKKDPVSGLDV